jgi:hypothetical protein
MGGHQLVDRVRPLEPARIGMDPELRKRLEVGAPLQDLIGLAGWFCHGRLFVRWLVGSSACWLVLGSYGAFRKRANE